MTFDEIQGKLDLLQENLQRLAQIPQESYDIFVADFRNVDSALHRLQTSIQALLDVGSHLVARLGLPTPGSNREILERLEEAEHLPAGSVAKFGPMVGFRNRVVHLYDRIDDRILYQILTEERDDLAELMGLLLTILQRGEAEG